MYTVNKIYKNNDQWFAEFNNNGKVEKTADIWGGMNKNSLKAIAKEYYNIIIK